MANVERRRRDIHETRTARRRHLGEPEEDFSKVLQEAPGMSHFMKRARIILEKRGSQRVHDSGSHAEVPVSQLWQVKPEEKPMTVKKKTKELNLKKIARDLQSRSPHDSIPCTKPKKSIKDKPPLFSFS